MPIDVDEVKDDAGNGSEKVGVDGVSGGLVELIFLNVVVGECLGCRSLEG